ncbi:desmoglein-4-like isoform 2-T2 [Rhinophrynus dorsalis]
MDWLLCAKFGAFFILMVSLQCNCNWSVQVNHGKDKNGKIIWEPLQLKRQKREWIVPPVQIREGEDNRPRNPIAKVHSDIQIKQVIRYTVSGQGVDRPPFNVFIINPTTGDLNVTSAIVDREVISVFYLVVRAIGMNGQDLEKPLELRVRVMDINDNPPVFSQSVFSGSIAERSSANTFVMRIFATDADEADTLHSQIAYKIISQTPSDPAMFIMNQFTGEVYTMSDYLDREQQSGFSLVVSGSDMNGAAGGLSGQCGANIKILDVNDNFPVLEFDSYSIQIVENSLSQGLLWMKVFDADEMYTDNWLAVFEIVSGNEGGWFIIETNPQTNEGVLKVIKELDYEAMQMANLGIIVRNRAAFHSSVISEYHAKVTNIQVQVENQKEGPIFSPNEVYANIPAGLHGQELFAYILTRFVALDMDTGKPATNIVYKKGRDVENWLVIDSTTGEVKLIYDVTRDSIHVVNGTYTATILAIDNETPSRTATATLVINIPVSNTQCPVILNGKKIACTDNPEVILQGYDNDTDPYGAPFTFRLLSVSDSTPWHLSQINATSAKLSSGPTSSRNITAQVIVTDKANYSCPQPWSVPIQLCDCIGSGADKICDASRITGTNVSLGPSAIGLIVLGLLMLLFAPLLLLLCACGAGAGPKFVPVADGYDGECRPWGTEGPKPEDDVTNMHITSGGVDNYDASTHNYMVEGALGAGAAAAGLAATAGGFRETSGAGFVQNGTGFGAAGMGMHGVSGESNIAGSLALAPPYKEGGTINTAFVENYFAEKADSYANEDESRPANDCLLIYDNEGVGSPAGSIGCCSFIADESDETYLDSLGPKFKTLAEICIGKEIEPELGGNEPRLFPNVPRIETDTTFLLEESSTNVNGMPSVPVNSSTYITESSYSSSNLQPARPITEPFIPGNVVVTETYTTSGGPVRPASFIAEPSNQPNILVTERVVESTSGVPGGFPEIPDGSNVIVTERVVRPASGVHDMVDFPNLPDGSNVVLRERVITPSTSRLSNSFNLPDFGDAQNVVVTERLIQPVSNVQGGLTFHPDRGAGQNVYVTEKTMRSGPGVQSHMLSTEPLLSQTMGSNSPSLTRSKVTKYSTVQYTKK